MKSHSIKNFIAISWSNNKKPSLICLKIKSSIWRRKKIDGGSNITREGEPSLSFLHEYLIAFSPNDVHKKWVLPLFHYHQIYCMKYLHFNQWVSLDESLHTKVWVRKKEVNGNWKKDVDWDWINVESKFISPSTHFFFFFYRIFLTSTEIFIELLLHHQSFRVLCLNFLSCRRLEFTRRCIWRYLILTRYPLQYLPLSSITLVKF